MAMGFGVALLGKARRAAGAIGMAGVLFAGAPQAAFAQPAPPPGVPTTKILAIGRLTAAGAGDARRDIMPSEVQATVRLYLGGKIDQWYVMQDGKGVVFILNGGDLDAAKAELEALPLGQAKMMTFELTPLGPPNPLRLLLTAPPVQAGN